jgi:hypothetical protein
MITKGSEGDDCVVVALGQEVGTVMVLAFIVLTVFGAVVRMAAGVVTGTVVGMVVITSRSAFTVEVSPDATVTIFPHSVYPVFFRTSLCYPSIRLSSVPGIVPMNVPST